MKSNETIANCFLILGIILLIAIIYKTYNKKEGLTSDKSSSSANGIAGNAEKYGNQIKTMTTQLQDQLLISKYRTDYENVITDMDDLIDNMMLKTVLDIDPKNPQKTIEALNALNMSKHSLDNVMKFVDKS